MGKGKADSRGKLEPGSSFLPRLTRSQVGCGTGLPCIYLLHRLLQHETPSDVVTEIHLQDYNISVLQLVTLPNLILATIPEDTLAPLENNLELTDEIIQGFKDRLRDANIKLSFSYGDWSGFAQTLQGAEEEARYDLVLTAETIYRLDSVPSLIQVLKRAPKSMERDSQGQASSGDVTSALDSLTLQKPWEAKDVVILVAAKVCRYMLMKTHADPPSDIILWCGRRNAGLCVQH
jgi:protein-histidine N-methyltransferase